MMERLNDNLLENNGDTEFEAEYKKTVFKTEWFDVEQVTYDQIESCRGKPYYRVNSPDGVIVLAVTTKNEIILVRQFRPALGKYTLEFPSGSIDEGETPEQAAVRELKEETGAICKNPDYLGAGRVMLNRHTCILHAFCARSAYLDPAFVPKEDIEAVLVSFLHFKNMVLNGAFDQYAALALVLLSEWKLGVS